MFPAGICWCFVLSAWSYPFKIWINDSMAAAFVNLSIKRKPWLLVFSWSEARLQKSYNLTELSTSRLVIFWAVEYAYCGQYLELSYPNPPGIPPGIHWWNQPGVRLLEEEGQPSGILHGMEDIVINLRLLFTVCIKLGMYNIGSVDTRTDCVYSYPLAAWLVCKLLAWLSICCRFGYPRVLVVPSRLICPHLASLLKST